MGWEVTLKWMILYVLLTVHLKTLKERLVMLTKPEQKSKSWLACSDERHRLNWTHCRLRNYKKARKAMKVRNPTVPLSARRSRKKLCEKIVTWEISYRK